MHDFVGHAFTAQLARSLASNGHHVTYASFGEFEAPKGRVGPTIDDPENFKTIDIKIAAPFNKDNLFKRRAQQIEYARKMDALVYAERPDMVMSSSAPIEVQNALAKASRQFGAGFVFWVQDIHAEAIERILAKRSNILGRVVGWYYRRKEAKLLRESEAVVVISSAFKDVFSQPRWGLKSDHMVVIENWANIADIPLLERGNAWAQTHMGDRPRIVYSGTLARKHDPELLISLAKATDADIYLFSQGSGANYVRQKAQAEGLNNIIVQPWVSVEELPKMLAGADILFAIIEADAGVYSVPSKVLSYLAAGRPILASIPRENLAAQNVLRQHAGLVSDPRDEKSLIANAQALLDDKKLRERMGKNGRAYAQKAFNIDEITQRFAAVLNSAIAANHNNGDNNESNNSEN